VWTNVDEIGARIGDMSKPELIPGWAGIRDGALASCCQSMSVPNRKNGRRKQRQARAPSTAVIVWIWIGIVLPGLQSLADRWRSFPQLRLQTKKIHQMGKQKPRPYRSCLQLAAAHIANTPRPALAEQIHKDSTANPLFAERPVSGPGRRRDRVLPSGQQYAATAATPGGEHESTCSPGFLRGSESVEMVDCLTVPMRVPAHAQSADRDRGGYVETAGERHAEVRAVTFHTGFYTPGWKPFPSCTSSA